VPTLPSTALRLPAELTIYTAAENRTAWLAWLAGEGDAAGHDAVCRIDAAAVDEVDAAGVQLLVALAHSLARQQSRLQLTQPSQPLRDACQDLGVASLLIGDPPEGSAA
jgi:phospholipid transport system transporter-binding protein